MAKQAPKAKLKKQTTKTTQSKGESMQSKLEKAKIGAQLVAALPIDAPRVPLSFDPIIGEQALVTCKAALVHIDAAQVMLPYCDAMQSSVVAMQLADQVDGPRHKAAFALLSAEVMGDATSTNLRTFAQATFYLETRARTKTAISNEVRVRPELVTEGTALRDRMLKVLSHQFDDDPAMTAEVAAIRSGTGYVDLASDLARVATHYSVHRHIVSLDKKLYVAADEDRARGISAEIMSALHSADDNAIADLRNRAWTKLVRTYAKLKAAADLLFIESPADLGGFPTLRQAVMALTSRSRSNGPADDTTADPAALAAPANGANGATNGVSHNVPIAPTTHAEAGAGPGGSPLG